MLALLLVSTTLAGEGMWLPSQAPALADALKAEGAAISAAALADPRVQPLSAIVHVGDWCSGAFVSSDGLVMSNHHCTWDLLQYNSTAEHNRVEEGFVAANRAEERWGGPLAGLYVVEKDQDITAAVLKKLKKGLSDADRARAIDRALSEAVAACERQPDRRCEAVSELGGRSFRLITQLRIRDLRLVYVPPMTVGEFGGDLDNFEWPRHDADFALLRAYVAPDGSAAPYAADNVPYHPPSYLPLNPAGVGPGDFVLVAGFPGATQRYTLADELRYLTEIRYPAVLAWSRESEAILAEEAAKDPAAAAALAGAQSALANSRKYYQGVLDNVRDSDVLQRRSAEEAAVEAWIAAQPDRAEAAGALAALRADIAAMRQGWQRDLILDRWLYDSDLLAAARDIVHFAAERARADRDREPGFQDRDREDLKAGLEDMQARLWLPADRRLLERVLAQNATQPPAARVAPLSALEAEPGAVDRLYAQPKLAEAAYRASLLGKRTAELAQLGDPWIDLALALEPLVAARHEARLTRAGLRGRLEPVWMGAVMEAKQGLCYPDANNTLRFTFGQVKGYAPVDGLLATPQTTVAGLLAKTRSPDYVAPPEAVIAALGQRQQSRFVDATLGDVPVNFLSDVDTTGGNSGSATLDASGRLVGLAFDGNYESMAADWAFDARSTRTIHVDLRYILFLLEQDGRASALLQELLGDAR